jgi:hypothetical protein
LVSRAAVCNPLEVEQALACARAHPVCSDDPAPFTA